MLHLFINNIKMFFKAKETLVWVIIMPFVFSTFFGFVFRNNNSTSDKPFFGYVKIMESNNSEIKNSLISYLDSKGYKEFKNEKDKPLIAEISIPENFYQSIINGEDKKLNIKIFKNTGIESSFRIKSTLTNYYINLIKTIVFMKEKSLQIDSFENVFNKKPEVYLEKIKGTTKKKYSGFDLSFAGNIVMFIIMNILIYGGISLNYDIKSGITKRILVGPISKFSFIFSSVMFRTFIGLFQAFVILIIGKLMFNVSYLNENYWLYPVLILFCLTIASLSIILGTIFSDEEKLSRLAILVTLPLAALGGCWWPLEIMPKFWQKIAFYLPTGNIMGTFTKVFLKNVTFADVQGNILYFAVLSIVFLYIGVNRLKKQIS